MAEGNPVLALERGERVELPPVLYLEVEDSLVHPRADLDRFVALYRAAGGEVELELIPGETLNPVDRLETIARFVHARLG